MLICQRLNKSMWERANRTQPIARLALSWAKLYRTPTRRGSTAFAAENICKDAPVRVMAGLVKIMPWPAGVHNTWRAIPFP